MNNTFRVFSSVQYIPALVLKGRRIKARVVVTFVVLQRRPTTMTNIVQMSYKCVVFAGNSLLIRVIVISQLIRSWWNLDDSVIDVVPNDSHRRMGWSVEL